jgi:tRNA-2-methylthio-N6-dimethylallyladenosine synthase
MEYVKYNLVIYPYSERPGTLAGRKMEDDVTEETKARRLQEIVDLQQKHAWLRLRNSLDKTEVLSRKFQKNQLKSFQEEKSYRSFPKIMFMLHKTKIESLGGNFKGIAVGLSGMNYLFTANYANYKFIYYLKIKLT